MYILLIYNVLFINIKSVYLMINLICGKQKHLQKKRSIKRTSIETLLCSFRSLTT